MRRESALREPCGVCSELIVVSRLARGDTRRHKDDEFVRCFDHIGIERPRQLHRTDEPTEDADYCTLEPVRVIFHATASAVVSAWLDANGELYRRVGEKWEHVEHREDLVDEHDFQIEDIEYEESIPMGSGPSHLVRVVPETGAVFDEPTWRMRKRIENL